MRIALTGGSSFTGSWFAMCLAEGGHEVVALLSGGDGDYQGIRGERVARLQQVAQVVFAGPFGGEPFLAALRQIGGVDRLCHHWAETRDYRSPDFDALAAAARNTNQLPRVLRALEDAGCRRLVLTDSVFAPNTGVGEPPLRAFSPYGLSKGLTSETVDYYCRRAGIEVDHFVVANPFGPWEEPRFTDYLMRRWFERHDATVATPRYVRDNIHVDLLAKAYAGFVAGGPGGGRRLGPSLYVESQGAFAERVALEMRARLPLACELFRADQTDFSEPRLRVNTDPCDPAALGWNEAAAWDAFARYYDARYGAGARRPS
jgi:UDP-glucose 4-epimerase